MGKGKGTSIIFFNGKREILMLLRDDIPSIPYPGKWDLVGGHVEDETVVECITREVDEELGLKIGEPPLFDVTDFDDRVETTFFLEREIRIDEINLTEGQRLKWFALDELFSMDESDIAFNFKGLIARFAEKKFGLA